MTKKFLIAVAMTVLIASTANAQEVKFGATAGFNMTNILEKGETYDMKPGFQLGVIAECAINEAFAIQPGILYAQQGFSVKSTNTKAKLQMNLNYIQIPINAMYKIELGEPKLLLQAGPYLGYGLGGKIKAWDEDGKKIDLSSDESKVKMGGKDDGLKAFDFGLGFGAGLQFGNIQGVVGYKLGLANIDNSGADAVKSRNNGLFISVAYLFGK